MKQLFNYAMVPGYEAAIRMTGMTLPQYIRSLGMDGIELNVYRSEPYMSSFESETVGVHMRSWGWWYDFWTGNTERLEMIFPDQAAVDEYYGGPQQHSWLLQIKRNIQAALIEKPEYLLFSFAEAVPEEQYSYSFAHTDKEVVKMAARVFNRVSSQIPDNVAVLFENSWWPGLRLTDPCIVEYFFNCVRRDNIGIMLDTAHLMNTNPDLKTEKEGIAYICSTLKKLGHLAAYVRGIHLSCSLSGEYQKKAVQSPERDMTPEGLLRHVINLDQHIPFTDGAAAQLLDQAAPDYLVHEFHYGDFNQLAQQISVQRKALGF